MQIIRQKRFKIGKIHVKMFDFCFLSLPASFAFHLFHQLFFVLHKFLLWFSCCVYFNREKRLTKRRKILCFSFDKWTKTEIFISWGWNNSQRRLTEEICYVFYLFQKVCACTTGARHIDKNRRKKKKNIRVPSGNCVRSTMCTLNGSMSVKSSLFCACLLK